jgi:hypothetical protein
LFADVAVRRAVDRIVSQCASPSEVVSLIRRKLRISRLSMRPQELMHLWQLLQTDEKAVEAMFVGADINALRTEIEVLLIKYYMIFTTYM